MISKEEAVKKADECYEKCREHLINHSPCPQDCLFFWDEKCVAVRPIGLYMREEWYSYWEGLPDAD